MELQRWENRFKQFLLDECLIDGDSAHDLAHIQRVVASAKQLAAEEKAEPAVVIPAAWLHDCVIIPKNHPKRSNASALAAEKAIRFLRLAGYENHYLDSIHHAIKAHSFSAGIEPENIEAKVVQDADRLDALGAVGISRCMIVGGMLGRPLYHPEDPFCAAREPDDKIWTIDHFYQKLFRLPGSMQTESGRKEAERRIGIMKIFLQELEREIAR